MQITQRTPADDLRHENEEITIIYLWHKLLELSGFTNRKAKIYLPFGQQVVFQSQLHLEGVDPKVVHQHDSSVHSIAVP